MSGKREKKGEWIDFLCSKRIKHESTKTTGVGNNGWKDKEVRFAYSSKRPNLNYKIEQNSKKFKLLQLMYI